MIDRASIDIILKGAKFILNDLRGIAKKYGMKAYDLPLIFLKLFMKGEADGTWDRRAIRRWAEMLFKDMSEKKQI